MASASALASSEIAQIAGRKRPMKTEKADV